MERIRVKISGVNALIMHNDDGVNPTNPITKAIKKITSKGSKKQTDDDIVRMIDLEFLNGLYHDDAMKFLEYVENAEYSEKDSCLKYLLTADEKKTFTNVPFVPAENLEATIKCGAKKNRLGTEIEKTLMVYPEKIPLISEADISIFDLIQASSFKDVRIVKLGKGKQKSSIMRSRPRFDKWALEFDVEYDPDIIKGDDVETAIRVAGREIGLCDYRPKYGRFIVDSIERVKIS